MKKTSKKQTDDITKQAGFYKTLSIILACILISICFIISVRYIKKNYQELGLIDIDKKGPYYEQIQQILGPLRYSGIQDLCDPDTGLSIDFKNKSWTLHNIHHFDKDGRILLKDGRYGLCGDLAVYLYEKIAPLLEDKYLIEFCRVAEANFFPLPQGSHIVLKITDKSFSLIPNIYILDPSFRKYQRIEQFEDYLFLNENARLRFYEHKDNDEIFSANTQSPILIKKDYMVGMSIDAVGDRFDPDNFAIYLNMTKRYRYFSRPIFSLQRKNGVLGTLKNEDLALKVLNKQEFEALCQKITYFFNNIK